MASRTHLGALALTAVVAIAVYAGAGCVDLEDYPCAKNDECPADYLCGFERRCVRCDTPLLGKPNTCLSTLDGTAMCQPLDLGPDALARCAEGTRCAVGGAGPACSPEGSVAAGEQCAPDARCEEGLLCISCSATQADLMGRCAPAEDNAACSAGLDCRCRRPCDFLHPDNPVLPGTVCAGACEPLSKPTDALVTTLDAYDGESNGPFVNGIWIGACYEGPNP